MLFVLNPPSDSDIALPATFFGVDFFLLVMVQFILKF